MNNQICIICTTDDLPRVDAYLSTNCDLSRSRIKKICEEGGVFVNDVCAKCNKILKNGDQIRVVVNEPVESGVRPENLPLDIVYQDKYIAVINKAQGVTVHSGSGVSDGTLVNALLYHLDSLSGINGVVRPGIVHRIDKNTSGLLVVAKNDFAHLALSKQLEDKTCKRVYLALLEGVVKTDSGVIDTFIERNQKDRTKMTVGISGRRAITEYKVVKRYKDYTLCEFSLKTGRTHQIRVHCKHIGHPIVGDKEYGFKNQKFNLNGQLLHAKCLEFVHPETNQKVSFSCPLPDYFEKVLSKLK